MGTSFRQQNCLKLITIFPIFAHKLVWVHSKQFIPRCWLACSSPFAFGMFIIMQKYPTMEHALHFKQIQFIYFLKYTILNQFSQEHVMCFSCLTRGLEIPPKEHTISKVDILFNAGINYSTELYDKKYLHNIIFDTYDGLTFEQNSYFWPPKPHLDPVSMMYDNTKK